MPVGAHPGATGITRKATSRPGAFLRELGASPVLQEVITLLVFAGFSTFYLGQSLKWNHWAAFGLILVAAFLMFKE